MKENRNFFDKITADNIHVNFVYDIILRSLVIIIILINLFELFRFIDFWSFFILWAIFTVLLFINLFRRKRNKQFIDARNSAIFLSVCFLGIMFRVIEVLFLGNAIFVYIFAILYLGGSIVLFSHMYIKEREMELLSRFDMKG